MAWLFVLGLEDSTSDSMSPSTDIELFVTLSGKPSARPLSWRGWKTRPWIRLLCGTISQPSTAIRGVESWISSLRDTRASHSPSLAVAPELKILVTSGPMSPGSSESANLDLFSLKTSPAICDSASMKSPATWTAWATKLRQHCLQRRKSAQATGGNGCSSWPTAMAKAWATPTQRDWKDGADPSEEAPTNSLLGRQAPRMKMHGEKSLMDGPNSPRQLNPLFVEWMMGLPPEWTDFAPLGMPLSRFKQRWRSYLSQGSLG